VQTEFLSGPDQNPGNGKQPKTKRRSSVVLKVNVRRSSRFLQRRTSDDSDGTVGSVFQEVSLEMKKKLSRNPFHETPIFSQKVFRTILFPVIMGEMQSQNCRLINI
jgi:hypothetical protein